VNDSNIHEKKTALQLEVNFKFAHYSSEMCPIDFLRTNCPCYECSQYCSVLFLPVSTGTMCTGSGDSPLAYDIRGSV
jgi:hypothetical protein